MIFKKKIVLPERIDSHYSQQLLTWRYVRESLIITRYQPEHSLVVFIGGAKDDVYGPVLNGIFYPYCQKQQHRQDVAYTTHGATEAVTDLVMHWLDAGKKVCLVGHSWGANAALKALRPVADRRVDLLVTLDGVSRRLPGKSIPKPGSVRQWFNVAVDYRQASMEYSNMVARLGGYWGVCARADKNINLSRDGAVEITHAHAARMFTEVMKAVEEI